MKYRVIEKNNKFYPQSRHCFFFWHGFEENGRIAWRTTLQAAKDAIAEFIEEQKIVVHEYP